MKSFIALSIIATAFAMTPVAHAGEEPTITCRPEIVDAITGAEAMVCRYTVTDGTGKEIMIEDSRLQGDVGSIGVAL